MVQPRVHPMAYGLEFQLSVILVDNLSSGFIYSATASLVYVIQLSLSRNSQFSSKFFMDGSVFFCSRNSRNSSWIKFLKVRHSWIWIENWNIFKCDCDTFDKLENERKTQEENQQKSQNNLEPIFGFSSSVVSFVSTWFHVGLCNPTKKYVFAGSDEEKSRHWTSCKMNLKFVK